MLERERLEAALQTLGELLQERGQRIAREDLICFKLYAAADQGERSKHFTDLQGMAPTHDELLIAARWTRTHDPSAGFLTELRGILSLFGVEARDGDL